MKIKHKQLRFLWGFVIHFRVFDPNRPKSESQLLLRDTVKNRFSAKVYLDSQNGMMTADEAVSSRTRENNGEIGRITEGNESARALVKQAAFKNQIENRSEHRQTNRGNGFASDGCGNALPLELGGRRSARDCRRPPNSKSGSLF